MIRRLGVYLAILAAPAMSGSVLDLSGQTSALVRTGDTLVFQLLTSSFSANAAQRNLDLYPTDVNFALVTAPLLGSAEFTATLQSVDGEVSVGLGDLSFGSGYFQSGQYTGHVSVLEGHLSLSVLDAAPLFGSMSIVIALQNKGPDVQLGLADYLLRQDLLASLSSGPLSVGAIPYSVELERPDRPLTLGNPRAGAPQTTSSTVPEPRTGELFLGGGALLYGFSALLAHVSRRAQARCYRAKNQPFASANPL